MKLQIARGKLWPAHKRGRLFFEAGNVARNNSLWFLEKRSDKTYKRCGGAENEETSRRKLFALVICSSTTTRNGLFATFLRRWQELIHHHRHRDQQRTTHGSILWTVHPQIQHVQSCTSWSHFITRTRVAQELEGSGLHIFVPLSSTCHVSFLAAPDTDHKHKFSLTHLIYFSYLSDRLTSTSSMVLDPDLPCDVPRKSGRSTQIPFLKHIPSTSCALSDTRSVADESPSKRKEAAEQIKEWWRVMKFA